MDLRVCEIYDFTNSPPSVVTKLVGGQCSLMLILQILDMFIKNILGRYTMAYQICTQ